MTTLTMLDDLYAHNDWANRAVLRMCQGLLAEQLDQPREMGFGSLRATLFHILNAEEIWLERWSGQPWRPLAADPGEITLGQIEEALQRTSQQRWELMNSERNSHWRRIVAYRNIHGEPFSRPLDDMLLHVANHGIYHRAQALSFLKGFGRTVPVGLDYLLYKLAHPSVPQESATIEAMRNYGLEVETSPGQQVAWDARLIRRYFAYHDWANGVILDLAAPLDAAAMDREFDLGPGSLRKTLIHLHEAERFWMRNWHESLSEWEHSDPQTSLSELRTQWANTAEQRNQFLDGLTEETAQEIVTVSFGTPPMKFRVVESAVQLCGHGTHHRAQLVNMLRHSGITAPALDFVFYVNQAGRR